MYYISYIIYYIYYYIDILYIIYYIYYIYTASTNIKVKIHKTKFEAGCSYKDCNQFLL